MSTTADKLNLLLNTKADIKSALIEKGQEAGDVFSTYADKIRAIETGVDLPELTNPASASDIVANKEAIDAEGNAVKGTVTEVDGEYYMNDPDLYKSGSYIAAERLLDEDILVRSGSSIVVQSPASNFGDATADQVAEGATFTSAAGLKVPGTGEMASNLADELSTQDDLISQIATALEGKTADSTPTVEQATPSITVSSSGLITASATQTAGKVAAGIKSATKQLTTQGAQTITPGTSNKTIASGRYLTGTQIIKGDANLVAENIKSGVSIFGVAGTNEGEGSKFYTDTITVSNDSITIFPGFEPKHVIGFLSAEFDDEVTNVKYITSFHVDTTNVLYGEHMAILSFNSSGFNKWIFYDSTSELEPVWADNGVVISVGEGSDWMFGTEYRICVFG